MTVKELIDKLSKIPEIQNFEVTINEIPLETDFMGYNYVKKHVTIREYASYHKIVRAASMLQQDIQNAFEKYHRNISRR